MINRSVVGYQIESKTAERGQEAADKLKIVGNPIDLSSQTKRESRNILIAGLGGHQNFLIDNMRRRPVGDKGQLEVVDVIDEGIDLRRGRSERPSEFLLIALEVAKTLEKLIKAGADPKTLPLAEAADLIWGKAFRAYMWEPFNGEEFVQLFEPLEGLYDNTFREHMIRSFFFWGLMDMGRRKRALELWGKSETQMASSMFIFQAMIQVMIVRTVRKGLLT